MHENTSAPRRRKRLTALLATLAAVGVSLIAAPPVLAASPAYSTMTLTATPAVTAGGAVTVTVTATDLTDAYAYDLTVAYDPALLAFDAASAGYPSGGYGSATVGTGTVTFAGTRLGTSPGLTGTQSLVSFRFTSLAAGSAAITVTGGSLVDSATTVTPITPGAPSLTATTTIAAAPPTGGGTGGGGGTGSDGTGNLVSTGTDDTTSSDPTGSLSGTGIDAGPWFATGAFAAALVALGVVLVIRRREATR
jgi:hypothetical protein